MPGDFGEFTVNIGLGINFLAGGTFYFNSNDTLSYRNLAIFLPNIVMRVMMAKNIFKIKQGGDINYIFLPNIVRRVMMA